MTTKQAADIIRMLLGYLKGEIEPPKQETIEEARAFEQQGYECLEMAIKALETVSCIKEKCAYCPHCENCDVDDETLEIKALEQQACEDAISREAVNDGFKKYENGSFAYGCVWGYINELPSVTPKSKSEYEHDHDVVKAYNDGQAYILDKIKAEVEAKCCITVGRENDGAITLYDIFEIIDKYRGE